MTPVINTAADVLRQSDLRGLSLLARGKVRDIYAVDDARLLIVQSDRISAFDVVMDEAIPGKGAVLTDMSRFWFSRLGIANHLVNETPESVVAADECEQITGRAMLVKRLNPLPIEAVCRGYLIGSGWKDYQQTGSVCGITLPSGLRLAEKLPEVVFTPATKAQHGEHDENISFVQMANIIGKNEAEVVRDASFTIYREAAQYAKSKGVIIADTKFEFAFDEDGELILIDEVLTPDSLVFGRPTHGDREKTRKVLTSNRCVIGWRKSHGTKNRRRRLCRRMLLPPPPSVIWTSASVCWERRIFEVHHWATYNLFQRDNKSKR